MATYNVDINITWILLLIDHGGKDAPESFRCTAVKKLHWWSHEESSREWKNDKSGSYEVGTEL